MGTVRDFKDLLLKRSGASSGGQFAQRSNAHLALWVKLNRLGARNMEFQPPESVPDIDATVHLTNQEWKQLEIELEILY